jgi:hypothetical protein
VPVDRFGQPVLGPEVVDHKARRHPSRRGDLPHRDRVRAALGEQPQRLIPECLLIA